MTNELHPIYQVPIKRYTERLQRLIDEEAKLEAEVTGLLRQQRNMDGSLTRKQKNYHKYLLDQKMAKRNARRRELKAEIDVLKSELETRLTEPSVEPFADEVPQPANECVGSCYGVCVYVDNTGELLYRETEPSEAEAVGESYAATAELRPFDELEPIRRTLVCDHLRSNPRTPFWAKTTYFKEDENHEDPQS